MVSHQKEEAFQKKPHTCSACKKPITVHYVKIEKKEPICCGMCADCPQLKQKFSENSSINAVLYKEKEIACGCCHTTWKEVKEKKCVGCEACYVIFDEIICEEWKKIKGIEGLKRKSTPLHVGRRPGDLTEIKDSIKLLALNEALSETLKNENYEQAALIRDQIRALTEKE